MEQDITKVKFGEYTIEEYIEKSTSLIEWAEAFMKIVFPSIDKDCKDQALCGVLLPDLRYYELHRRLERAVDERMAELKQNSDTVAKLDTDIAMLIDGMLKQNGIKKEN